MRVRTQAVGPAAIGVAWARYADPDRWTTWAPHLRSVELVGGAEGGSVESADSADGVDGSPTSGTRAGRETVLREGLRGIVTGPWGLAVRFVVTAVDERACAWSWTVRSAGVTLDLDHTLAELPGVGTRAGLTISGPTVVVLAYRPVARWALHRLLRDDAAETARERLRRLARRWPRGGRGS